MQIVSTVRGLLNLEGMDLSIFQTTIMHYRHCVPPIITQTCLERKG